MTESVTRVPGDKLNAIGWQPVLHNIGHKLWIDDQRDLVVGLQPPRRVGFTMRQEAAVTRDGRLFIPSVAASRPCERGWLRTDVDRDAVADHGVLWHFRWREAVALHDDAAPSEGSTGEQQRAGRRGWVSFPCPLVDEQVFAGSREGVHGRAVRADQMHPADSIEDQTGRGVASQAREVGLDGAGTTIITMISASRLARGAIVPWHGRVRRRAVRRDAQRLRDDGTPLGFVLWASSSRRWSVASAESINASALLRALTSGSPPSATEIAASRRDNSRMSRFRRRSASPWSV